MLDLLPLVVPQYNERWSCNCNDYHLLSLVSPTLCPRCVIFRVLKLEAGDYSSHLLIWRHKNNVSRLFPTAIATYFNAWVFQAQALTCSVDQCQLRFRSHVSRKLYVVSKVSERKKKSLLIYFVKHTIVSPFQRWCVFIPFLKREQLVQIHHRRPHRLNRISSRTDTRRGLNTLYKCEIWFFQPD